MESIEDMYHCTRITARSAPPKLKYFRYVPEPESAALVSSPASV